MVDILAWLNSALYDGLPYALVVLSFVLTFKYLRFPDITCTGTFVLGAAVAAVSIVRFELNPHAALVLAFVAGAGGGAATGFLNATLRIEPVLAGVISAFGIYAFNLLLLRPTVPYGAARTVLSRWEELDRHVRVGGIGWHPFAVLYLLAIAVVAKFALDRFLKSETGLLLRALEDDHAGADVLRRRGASPERLTILGLMLANGLVATAGGLVSMKEGAANVHRGFDVLITGIVAFLVGTQLARFWGAKNGVPRLLPTTAAVLGSLFYFGLIALSLRVGVPPELTKILLAGLIAFTVGTTFDVSSLFARARDLRATSGVGVGEAAASLDKVSYHYPGSQNEVLNSVSLQIPAGHLVSLRGPNGSGKTTLLRLLAGFLAEPQSGSIHVGSEDLTHEPSLRLRNVTYVEQDARRGVVKTLTVEENLALSVIGHDHRMWRRAITPERRALIHRISTTGGLPPQAIGAIAMSLSGGQLQVVNLLGLMVRSEVPRLVLFDEPLGNLDQENQNRFWGLLRELKRRGTAVIIVSHVGEAIAPDSVLELPLASR